METGLVSSANLATTSTTKTPSQSLDKNAFLSLLVAQLKNQDPTNAQDPNQMVQQMTSYSQLEQAQNSNSLLQGLQLQNQSLFQAQAAGLIGKKVHVATSNFDLKSGNASVGVDLPSAANVVLTIKDAAGNTVATLDEGSQTTGTHVFDWNGKDAAGKPLADGTYTVEIAAKDSAGNKVDAKTTQDITVTSIGFVDGAVVLKAGGQNFYFSDVLQISA
jgi:flagellar basal-body rod modification protein FlgD